MYLPDFSVSLEGKSLEITEDFEAYYTIAGETWKKPSKYTTRQIWAPGKCTIRVVGINSFIGELIATVNINAFNDIKASDFFYDPVLWAVENGITNGLTATTFGPTASCNRAQVVTFLWRAAGSPAPATAEHSFVDVEAGSFYEQAVLWALEKGITTGTDATHFSPNTPCNRATVVTFLYRAFENPAVQGAANPFSDVPADTWYTAPVLWALENEITNGMGDGTFGINTPCNRAQIVTFLHRAYN